MQWPNQEIHPPMNPYGPFIAVFTHRYPPPVSGNAEPSSMYAIAVNRVTTKFRTNTRRRAGPTIARPGPTRRKIVVPTVGPRPIIVISRSPRSLRNRTSTSSGFFPNRYAVAMGTGVDEEGRIKFVGGRFGPKSDDGGCVRQAVTNRVTIPRPGVHLIRGQNRQGAPLLRVPLAAHDTMENVGKSRTRLPDRLPLS